MSGYVRKAPGAPVAITMDWGRGHLGPGERVARDLGWAIRPSAPGELVVARQGQDACRTWAVLDGGVCGKVYIISNRVLTSDERVLARAIVLRVARGPGKPEENP